MCWNTRARVSSSSLKSTLNLKWLICTDFIERDKNFYHEIQMWWSLRERVFCSLIILLSRSFCDIIAHRFVPHLSSGSNSCPDLNQVNVGSSPGARAFSWPLRRAKTSLSSEKEMGGSQLRTDKVIFWRQERNLCMLSLWVKWPMKVM